MTIIQNARTSGGGVVTNVPLQALSVGPVETWQAERVSIWHAGQHDNPFGQRLTALMISKRVSDAAVPMSLLADHPNVEFHYLRSGLGHCDAEMH
jgi:glucosamine-6-phosphate deaminase